MSDKKHINEMCQDIKNTVFHIDNMIKDQSKTVETKFYILHQELSKISRTAEEISLTLTSFKLKIPGQTK